MERIFFAVAGLLVAQAVFAGETGSSRGTEHVRSRSGTTYQIQNLKTGACAEYRDGELVGAAPAARCADRAREGVIRVGSRADRRHQAEHLGLTPRYDELSFPEGTVSITIDGERRMKFHKRRAGLPNDGCVFHLARLGRGFSGEMTILLEKPEGNVTRYPFVPDLIAPDKRRWVARSETTGEKIGEFECDTEVGDSRRSMEYHLNRWWYIFSDIQ